MDDTTPFTRITDALKSSPNVEWDIEELSGIKYLWYVVVVGGNLNPMTVLSQYQIESMTDERLTELAIELTFGEGV
jgi:hypothetical protein